MMWLVVLSMEHGGALIRDRALNRTNTLALTPH